MIEKRLISRILDGYALTPMGMHGLPHWGRVLETGLRLARHTGADTRIVELFAVFHDSRRINDHVDNGHGRRGSVLARSLRRKYLDISDRDFSLLVEACDGHTEGRTKGDITVQTCWDSDRLDLWRAGITPHESYLCTDAAKDAHMIEWSRERSLTDFTPSFVTDVWLK